VHEGHAYLGLAWPALEWLEAAVDPGMSTLETGAGASTIVFAARGASHVAISPSADEHERIVGYCREHGIPTERIAFIAESSHSGLRDRWEETTLDVVLIDGAHSFPFPVLDWSFVAPHMRAGAWLLVDDAYQPAVNVLVRYLRAHPSWRLERVLGHRTPLFRKLDDSGLDGEWNDETLGRPRFDYLRPVPRALASLRYHALEHGPLQPALAGPLQRLHARLGPGLRRAGARR
jgi:hypothetical protein